MINKNERVIFSISIKEKSLKQFKEVCNKHHIPYSKLINLLMDYTVKIDTNTDIIQVINQELIQ